MLPCLILVFLLGVTAIQNVEQASAFNASKELNCQSPFDEVGGRCVYVDLIVVDDWLAMRNFCINLGGDLISLDSGDLFAKLMEYFNKHGLPEVDYWVGATDEGHEGVWVWVDGSVVEMGTPFWAIGCHDNQLPDGGTYENCAVLSKAYSLYFDDVSCDGIAYAICEL